MTRAGEPRIRWAPKVRRSKIFRLYQQDALGLLDAELAADVGYDLLARCRSILMVTEARQVDCPACQTEITCAGERWSKAQPILCPSCGWQATYGQWRDSWRHQNLTGGNAMAVFRAYVMEIPKAKTAPERMVLIDRLIHEFHWSMRHQRTHAPVGSNLIEGTPEEVLAFLNSLTYGDGSTPGLEENQADWRNRLASAAETFPFLRERVKRSMEGEE